MDRRIFAATVLAAVTGAAGLAAAATSQGMTSHGDRSVQTVAAPGMEKCYGINAAGRNDCAAGAHSCAGQATSARDGKSFVLLPAGACGKIAGGSIKPI